MFMMTTYTTNRDDLDLINVVNLGVAKTLESLIASTISEIVSAMCHDWNTVVTAYGADNDDEWVSLEKDKEGKWRFTNEIITDIKTGLVSGKYTTIRIENDGDGIALGVHGDKDKTETGLSFARDIVSITSKDGKIVVEVDKTLAEKSDYTVVIK